MQMKENETKGINIKATAWTAGVHVVLLLLFLLVKYSAPANETPVQELGMEVNLGTSDDGSGTDQPMDMEDPAPEAAVKETPSRVKDEGVKQDIASANDNDAPTIRTSDKPKPVRTDKPAEKPTNVRNTQPRPTTNTTQRPQPQRPRYVYAGSNGRGGNSASENRPGTGEGNTQGPGDRGVPGGTPGASNYTGTPGRGTGGISHNLSGRNIIAFPPPDADFREGGRVVIRITVNKAGAIVNKQVKSASNAEIRAIALRKVDKIKFNKSDDAPEEQFGDVTFVFKTRS